MRGNAVMVVAGVLALLVGCARPGTSASSGGSVASTPGAAAPAASPGAAAPATAAETSPTPGELRKVRLAYGFVSTTDIPMWVADDQGIWQKYGLSIDATLLQSSAQIAPAMAAGEVDVALTAGAGVVDIDLAGGEQKLISSLQSEMSFFVHAQPDIHSVEDLRGKQIGITRRGSGTNLAADIVLDKAGLAAGPDVAIQELGTVQSELSALTSGQIAAVVLSAPTNFLAERQGYPLIARLSDYHVPYSQGALAATRGTLTDRYELIRDFTKAFVEALGVAKRDPALAKRVLGANTQTTDQDLLDKSYALWLEELDPTLQPSLAAVQTVLDQRADERPNAKTANPKDFVDTRIIDELRASGFLSQQLGAEQPAAQAR
ncbi:MAG TPA: ABC transporter substrate-binding protein [Chloroflexota bacterium]|nr:ABC transporter substrate-binding protein [Chloroflexota bacterium]